MHKIVKKLALVTCIGMFLVVVMGTLVTKTESGRGCGDDWPLCNGKYIPAYTIESLIEYSHRFVTGIEGLLVLATFIAVWSSIKRRDARFYAGTALFFTFVQALMGAAAVKWPQSSAVLALHFGFSLLAFSGTLLLVILLYQLGRKQTLPTQSSLSTNLISPSRGLRWGVWATTLYCYVVVYVGAYVKHSESSGGCIGWPLCNGEVIPELSGATGIVFIHRVAAILLLVWIILLYIAATKSISADSDLRSGFRWLLITVTLQIFSGAWVTFSLGSELGYLVSGMVHAVVISGLFGILCYLSVWMMDNRPAGVNKDQLLK